ncbi:MAG: hypothetical protein ABIA04_06150 [Pseudomonadota bacterium]
MNTSEFDDFTSLVPINMGDTESHIGNEITRQGKIFVILSSIKKDATKVAIAKDVETELKRLN